MNFTPSKHSNRNDSFETLKSKWLLRNTQIEMTPSKHSNWNDSFETLKSKWLLQNIQIEMICSKYSFSYIVACWQPDITLTCSRWVISLFDVVAFPKKICDRLIRIPRILVNKSCRRINFFYFFFFLFLFRFLICVCFQPVLLVVVNTIMPRFTRLF